MEFENVKIFFDTYGEKRFARMQPLCLFNIIKHRCI